MKIFISILLLLFSFYTSAQNWLWAKGAAYIDDGYVAASAVTSNGDVVVAGNFFGTLSLGGVTLSAVGTSEDVFIAKYSTTGQVIWAKSFKGAYLDRVHSVALDSQDNIYISGICGNTTLQFETTVVQSKGSFLFKLDNAGNVLWALTNSFKCQFQDLRCTANDQLVVGGSFFDTLSLGNTTFTNTGQNDFFLAKFTPAGSLLWCKKAAYGFKNAGGKVAADPSGNIYLAGEFTTDSITFGNGVVATGTTSMNAFLVRYDSAGVAQWARGLSTDTYAGYRLGLAVSGGSVFLGGNYRNPTFQVAPQVVLQTGCINTSMNSCMNSFLLAYTLSGNFLWAKHVGGNWNGLNALDVDQSGKVTITGPCHSTFVSFGNVTYTSTTTNFNLYVANYDPDGSLNWSLVNGNNNDSNIPNAVSAGQGGEVFVSGYHINPLVLGSTTLSTQGLPKATMFVAKIGQGNLTSVIERDEQRFFVFSPNPARGFVDVDLHAASTIIVSDCSGKIIRELKGIEGINKLDLQEFTEGLYMLTVREQNRQYSRKLVVQH